MNFTKERLTELAVGYGLDGGGYEFENPTNPTLLAIGCVIWESPDLDYFCGFDAIGHGQAADLLAFAPRGIFGNAAVFPLTLPGPWEDRTYHRIASGYLSENEHECNCYGVHDLDEPLGWEFTGNVNDKPYPKCERCNGDGYVLSEGGSWAIYECQEVEHDTCGDCNHFESDGYPYGNCKGEHKISRAAGPCDVNCTPHYDDRACPDFTDTDTD